MMVLVKFVKEDDYKNITTSKVKVCEDESTSLLGYVLKTCPMMKVVTVLGEYSLTFGSISWKNLGIEKIYLIIKSNSVFLLLK